MDQTCCGPQMFWTKYLFKDRQRALIKLLRSREVVLFEKYIGEIREASSGVGMFEAENIFMNRQRALKERPRAHKVALFYHQPGEVSKAHRRLGMLGA